MKLSFTKMQGCSNDYIYIDCMKNDCMLSAEQISAICDRHRGIGSDGVVFIKPSVSADATMRMFNCDGSEGKMCGNAIRCVGKYLFDNGYVKSESITVETLSGIKKLDMTIYDGKAIGAKVDMGCACFDKINERAEIGKSEYAITALSVGNPHCVIFYNNANDISGLELNGIGSSFQKSDLFPDGVNVEFIAVESDTSLFMRVYERGSGETQGCGTGACAAVAAAVKNGFCPADTDINVHLHGGTLTVNYSEKRIILSGNCVKVFDGEIEI